MKKIPLLFLFGLLANLNSWAVLLKLSEALNLGVDFSVQANRPLSALKAIQNLAASAQTINGENISYLLQYGVGLKFNYRNVINVRLGVELVKPNALVVSFPGTNADQAFYFYHLYLQGIGALELSMIRRESWRLGIGLGGGYAKHYLEFSEYPSPGTRVSSIWGYDPLWQIYSLADFYQSYFVFEFLIADRWAFSLEGGFHLANPQAWKVAKGGNFFGREFSVGESVVDRDQANFSLNLNSFYAALHLILYL